MRRCLDSLVSQTLREIEIIAVNDASPDGCGVILHEYACRDVRLKVITHDSNHGAAAARNTGLAAARGQYVGFLDADDYVDSTMFESLVREADDPPADLVLCGMQIIHPARTEVCAPVVVKSNETGPFWN